MKQKTNSLDKKVKSLRKFEEKFEGHGMQNIFFVSNKILTSSILTLLSQLSRNRNLCNIFQQISIAVFLITELLQTYISRKKVFFSRKAYAFVNNRKSVNLTKNAKTHSLKFEVQI